LEHDREIITSAVLCTNIASILEWLVAAWLQTISMAAVDNLELEKACCFDTQTSI